MWAVAEDCFINIFVHIPSSFAQLLSHNLPEDIQFTSCYKSESVLNLRRTDQGQGLKAVIADTEIRR